MSAEHIVRLAVIPARGGSKRIPRKNLREFCGKPMIAWSIEAARASAMFDGIVVSTDNAEIAAVAADLGAAVPFMRPAALADDHTGTAAVVSHAIDAMRDRGHRPNAVCCLYATAPFVRPGDLRLGFETLCATAADYTFSATSYAFPIERALHIDAAGAVEMIAPEHRLTRSQDLQTAYHDAGQFYWGKATAWCAAIPFFGRTSRAVLLPRHRVQDIDTDEDWLRAEWLFRALQAEDAQTVSGTGGQP